MANRLIKSCILTLVFLLGSNTYAPYSLAVQDANVKKSTENADIKKQPVNLNEKEVAELDKALAEVKRQRREIEKLKKRAAKSKDRQKDIIEIRLDKAWLALLKHGLNFSKLVANKQEKNKDVNAYLKQVATILGSQTYIAEKVVTRIRDRIKIPDGDLTATKLAVVSSKIFELSDTSTEADQLLLDSLELSKTFGLDMRKQEQLLKDNLEERAENISIILELAQSDLTALKASFTAIADDTELKTKQAVLNIYIKNLATTLADISNMMDKLNLDTLYYRQQILSATGELTAKVADVGVMTGLLIDWSKRLTSLVAEEGPNFIFKVLIFIFIIFIFRKLSKFVQRIMTKALNRTHLKSSELLRTMAVSIAGNLIFLFGILIALSQLGISLGPLLAGLGVVGFVIGFALQDSLSNFASGMMILIYRPFDVGDLVETGGVFGTVHDMSLVNTTIMTLDNQTIVVPNSKIWGDVIKNVTAQKNRRIDMTFGISYTDDIEKTERVLADIVAQHDKVLADPEPMIHLHELADSSVNFIVRPWVNRDDYWDVYWDITRSVKMRFDQEGISIPFPQRDVHLYNATT